MSLAVPQAVFYAGIDWAAETHAVCVMDLSGKVVARFTIAHSAEGLDRLVRLLAALGDPAGIPAAIERPSGRLVDALLEAGHPVVPVSPNAIKTWRDGEVLPGANSDAGDAEVIAEYLRLRCHRLRVAAPYAEETTALRTVTRSRDDLVDTRVAVASPRAAHIYNQARASGKDHPHAIRILARAWIRVIWPCWVNGIPYDPGKHGAAATLMRQAEEELAA